MKDQKYSQVKEDSQSRGSTNSPPVRRGSVEQGLNNDNKRDTLELKLYFESMEYDLKVYVNIDVIVT